MFVHLGQREIYTDSCIDSLPDRDSEKRKL